MRLTKVHKAALAAGAAAIAVVGVAGCDSSPKKPSARSSENKKVSSNYSKLVANQPAHEGDYSPTRATKNFWIDTWMKDPNKLSYVYIQNANGDVGYFVLKGLPVTYCVSLLPPETTSKFGLGNGDGNAAVTQKSPSMDGTYGSNTNCTSYYGEDAVTGAYVEFSVGQNQSYFLFDKPMNLPQYKSAKPLGPATIDAVKNK